jgi:hypothetical protein
MQSMSTSSQSLVSGYEGRVKGVNHDWTWRMKKGRAGDCYAVQTGSGVRRIIRRGCGKRRGKGGKEAAISTSQKIHGCARPGRLGLNWPPASTGFFFNFLTSKSKHP